MASRLLPGFQFVVTRRGHVVAYTVTLPSHNQNEIFVWQLGIGSRAIAVGLHFELLRSIRIAAEEQHVRHIVFTLLPENGWLLDAIQKVFEKSAQSVTREDQPPSKEDLMEVLL